MPVPTANTPIPQSVRGIIERVHSRLPGCGGLALDDPRNLPLTAEERHELARQGYYPPPAVVIQLGMTPAEHQMQVILDAVATQMPEAVLTILEAARP